MRHVAHRPTVSVGIYARLSKDPTGDKQNIAGQERRCRDMATRRGWSVVDVYVDRDRPASGSPTHRPEFLRLCDDLRGGRIDGIVALDQDRLVREPHELESLLELCKDVGVTRVLTSEGNLTANGGTAARSRAIAASEEISRMMLRHRRKQEDIARAGRWGGGYRAFGYSADHLTTNEEEASLIRDAARRIIDGGSAESIAREWNGRGVTTALGNRWRGKSIRRLVTAPTITGLRDHNGTIVAQAVWPPVLDRPTWEAVRAALASRPEAKPGLPPREYLLTGGVAICGLCRAPLRARPRADKVQSYVCVAEERQDGSRPCGGVRCVAEPFETTVTDALLSAIAAGEEPDRVDSIIRRDHTRRTRLLGLLSTAEQSLAQIEERYLEGDASRTTYLRVRGRRHDVIRGLREELAATAPPSVDSDGARNHDVMEKWWASAALEEKRALLGQLIAEVRVKPAAHRGARFSADRIQIVWAQ